MRFRNKFGMTRSCGGVAGVSPAERVAENAAGGWSEGETSPSLLNHNILNLFAYNANALSLK